MAKFGIDDPGEHQHWDYLENLVGRKKFSWLWTSDAAEMVFGRLDLIYPGAVDAVTALKRENEIHFVTHRNPRRTSEVTGRWLNYWFEDYNGVHVLNNRCKKWELGEWDVFIDDKPSTVLGFLKNTDALMLMPERAWNVDDEFMFEAALSPNFESFGRWTEVEGLIAKVSA